MAAAVGMSELWGCPPGVLPGAHTAETFPSTYLRRWGCGQHRATASAAQLAALALPPDSRKAQLLAHGHPDLLLDQVHTRDHLGHGVLHLRADGVCTAWARF